MRIGQNHYLYGKHLSEETRKKISLARSDNIDNIQPLCQSCNTRKHAKIISYLTTKNSEERRIIA